MSDQEFKKTINEQIDQYVNYTSGNKKRLNTKEQNQSTKRKEIKTKENTETDDGSEFRFYHI